MDIGQKKGNQLYIVSALALLVLAVSLWAFVQGVQREMEPVAELAATRQEEQKQDVQQETYTVEELGTALLEQISFDTELTAIESSVAGTMVGTQSGDTEVILYMGEGTCADELLVLRAADEDGARAELDSVQQHLGEMQASFEDYLPGEAKKIEDAVIVQQGSFVIACVTSDAENAQKVIQKIQIGQ